MNKITYCLLMIFAATSCKEAAKAPPAEVKSNITYYGDTISAAGALGVSDVLSSLQTNDTVFCAVSGYVTSVCKVKGCWMVLSQNQEDSTGIFVKFKDYAFFVPKDLTGKVTVKGIAFKEVTSVDELKHYAEDEGKSKEEIDAITEPQEEMKFLADGVQVLKEN